MKELQKTAEEFIGFLDTYIEDHSTPITPEELERRGFHREHDFTLRIRYTKGSTEDRCVSITFHHADQSLATVEVTDWPRSHACIRETITTVEQLNQLLNLMNMEAV